VCANYKIGHANYYLIVNILFNCKIKTWDAKTELRIAKRAFFTPWAGRWTLALPGSRLEPGTVLWDIRITWS
jgi:hypothetical protein